jgi:glycosyltransferase involved in cell wall biosynthesis
VNVFIFTSVPIEPPWDQGDKNFAYSLINSLPQVQFSGLNSALGPTDLAGNLKLFPVYQGRTPSLIQKAKVMSWLYFRRRQFTHTSESRNRLSDPPDLYHLIYRPNRLSSYFFRRLPEFKRRPLIHTVPAAADERLTTRRLFFAERLVALSVYGKQKLENLGLDNISYIPIGIDYSSWQELRYQCRTAKRKLGLDNRPVMLYPGHFGQGYGSKMIIEALESIAKYIPDIRLIFACRIRSTQDFELESTIRRDIAQKGLDQNIIFYHTVSDMRTLIAASDLVTLPLETMRDKVDIPTTLLEALAAGKPILTTDLAPMNEIFDRLDGWSADDCVGVAVKPGDLNGFVRSAIELLSNAYLRERMGALGQKLIEQRYNICHVASQYENLYLEIVG